MEWFSILLKKGKAKGNLTGAKVSKVVKILHLIFFDDVLIMKKASIEEWMMIKTLLELFCCASRLKLNLNKSTIHHAGIQGEALSRFHDTFSYKFTKFSGGFRYLGYFIKYENTSFEDWRWIIINFWHGIKHWCNRWLSLGDRCILAKQFWKHNLYIGWPSRQSQYLSSQIFENLYLNFFGFVVENNMVYISAARRYSQSRNT